MRAKSMVLIVIALGCGLIASIGISQVMDRGQDDSPEVATAPVLVAATDIDIGERFHAENVRLEQWPTDRIPLHAIGSLEQLKDRYPRTRMYAGEVILAAKLLEGDLGSPSITIPEGYRVASVRVSMDSSVSGLVLPGDRVDIVAYLKQGNEVPRTVTRTILRDVRVFAVDSRTERELDNNGNPVQSAKTVSLLVKRDQVEPLMLALELGTLRLSLRRPNEPDETIAANEATVESILGRPAELADERGRQQAAARPEEDFLRFLNAPAAAPAADVVHEMTILTPHGISRFLWDREGGAPREVQGPDAAPTTAPAGSDLPADPDDASRTGGDEGVDSTDAYLERERSLPSSSENTE